MEECPEVLIDRIHAALAEPQSRPHSPLQLAWRGGGGEACDHGRTDRTSFSQTSSASADEAELSRHTL
jgi:hypothetical protein